MKKLLLTGACLAVLVGPVGADPTYTFAAVAKIENDVVSLSFNQPTMDKAKSIALLSCKDAAVLRRVSSSGCRIAATFSFIANEPGSIGLLKETK
jgi:hypothetical protein